MMQRLKEETRPHHDQIERNPLMARVMQPDLTLPEYQQVLARLYGFHRPVETHLAAWSAWDTLGFDYDARRKAALLAHDLHVLGLPPEAVAALPLCTHLPVLNTPEQVLGCLYVLEGSTLGGHVIARQLGRTLGIDAARGAAFYTSYGNQIGPMWKALGQRINTWTETLGLDAEQMIGAAAETFHCMDAWMQGT
jgi:heme oxygenase